MSGVRNDLGWLRIVEEIVNFLQRLTHAGIYRFEKCYLTIILECAIFFIRTYLTVFFVACLVVVGFSTGFFNMVLGTIL